MDMSKEPIITINGTQVTNAMAMTIRVAIESFSARLQDGLGEDLHGKSMVRLYNDRIQEIRDLIFKDKTT